MMPAVFDRVVLDESMLELVGVAGKMNLPMGFLPPFFPSELWLAFQLGRGGMGSSHGQSSSCR
jgi:hypothetical protein